MIHEGEIKPGMRTHRLKCWPEPFQAIMDGRKCFEFRKNDRGFAVGDFLELVEWEPSPLTKSIGLPEGGLTGRSLLARVTYVLIGGYGVPDGYAVLSIYTGPSDVRLPTNPL